MATKEKVKNMKYEYSTYNERATDEELLSDMKRVFDENHLQSLTMKSYSSYGKFDCSTIIRRFGTWNDALKKLNLPIKQQYWTEKQLFENIEQAWIKKGSQPRRSDMNDKSLSFISSGAYLRKFGKWSTALQAFVEYMNEEETELPRIIQDDTGSDTIQHRTRRDVSLRLRFKVLQRDNFKCCMCGATPAKDPSVELHIDHIVPWSKGGETVIDNLQTLCSKCNLGKSDLE